MASVNVYLTFSGNCEEAFNFYKSVFGGEFGYVGRYKDMPPQDGQPLSQEDAEKVMHISLPLGDGTVLMGADSSGNMAKQIIVGNNFSLSVNTGSMEEADDVFNKLSAGGFAIMPMNKTFWGSYFGMLTDKFGINWMVSFEQNDQ